MRRKAAIPLIVTSVVLCAVALIVLNQFIGNRERVQ